MSGDCHVGRASGETFDQRQKAASWIDRLSPIVPLPLYDPNAQSQRIVRAGGEVDLR